MEISPFYKLKCLFIGAINCGKSSFCHLINHDEHCYDSEPTIGLAYSVTKVELQEYPLSNPKHLPDFYLENKKNKEEKTHNQIIKLELWDCAGSMRYRNILNSYMRNVDICLLFFDLTNRESFEEISKWKQQIIQNSATESKFAIIANKADLKPYSISLEELKKVSSELNIPYFIFSCVEEGSHLKAKRILYNLVKEYHEQLLTYLEYGRAVPDYVTLQFYQPKKSDLIFLNDNSHYTQSQCCIIF